MRSRTTSLHGENERPGQPPYASRPRAGLRMTAFWAGIDWSERYNDVAVVDHTGTVVARTRAEETPDGVKEILRLLAGLRSSHRHSRKHVPIAIESTDSLLVAALRAAGQTVIPINPTVAARYRGRLNPERKKSDKTDAAMLANIIRTDGARLRGLPEITAHARAITALSRAQQRADRTRTFHFHRLRSVLRAVHPVGLTAWKGLPGGPLRPEARAVLRVAPTPTLAAQLSRRQLRDILREAGRSRLVDHHADRLFVLFHEKSLRQPPEVEEAMAYEIQAHLAMIDEACAQADLLAEHLAARFHAHPQAEIYLSFPGVGELTGARLLAEIGDDPARFADRRDLRAYAGAAPLTWASGGSETVRYRTVANTWLRATGHNWAFASLIRSPGCRDHYDRRRASGDRHAAALRSLFGRLLMCLHQCLREQQLYDEDRALTCSSACAQRL